MRRIRAALAVVLAGAAVAVVPATAADAHTVTVIAGYTVNMRTGPGTQYSAIGTVTPRYQP